MEAIVNINGFGLYDIQTHKLITIFNKEVYEKINGDIFCFFDCLC